MNRSYRIVFIVLLLTSWLTPTFTAPLIPSAQAQSNSPWLWASPDLDGDGLPNNVEISGWCNSLGCFQTDPVNADSDGDGLSDGYEKLFESHPTNSNSPGIYVLYQDSFKTKQYYPWQPYGTKLIARGDDFSPPRPDTIDASRGQAPDLDAVIARRGTTFYVGGPPNIALQISKSRSSLTTLSPAWDPLAGMWRVALPPNGTVGKYTLTLGSNSMDLFVIFELPRAAGQLSQLGIEKFLYDDDSNKRFDDRSVLMYDEQQSDRNGFIAIGHSYEFENQQYNRYLFEDYVIPAINGESTQRGASSALTNEVDRRTAFRNPRPLTDSWKVLHPGANVRQQCSNIAALLTAFSRSAGIPARPVIIDWRDDTFDHSTEIWNGSTWRAYRAYVQWEVTADGTPQNCGSSWPRCGTYQDMSRSGWAHQYYKPWHSGGSGDGNVVVLADDNWVLTGGTGYRWRSWSINTILLNENKLKTQHTEYWRDWGWNTEPTNVGSPNAAGIASDSEVGALASEGASSDFQSPQIQLGNVLAEYGVDLNGNGQYDQLVLEAEVTASQAGSYWLLGQLSTDHPEQLPVGTGMLVAQALTRVDVAQGTQVVRLPFDGTEISLKRVDGPYQLSSLKIVDGQISDFDHLVPGLAQRTYFHTTQPYQARDFETYGAMLSGSYAHSEADSNADGSPDALVVNTSIDVYQPGNYTVEANLYDAQDTFVAHATWTGTGPEVSLRFEDAAGTVGPYRMRELDLINSEGQSIDYLPEAYTISAVRALANPAVASLSVLPSDADQLLAAGQTITPTRNFAASIVNGNLVVQAQVQVAQAGSYKLEAWLADAKGNLLTWATGQPAALAPGIQNLSLTFGGPAIRARGVAGPYQVVALKILDGNANYTVLDKVNVAFTTQAYGLNQFSNSGATIFEDYVENGGSRWSAESGWSITEAYAFSPSHAWYASNANASLTLAAPISLANRAPVALRIQTAYAFGSGEAGYLEVSTNASAWTRLAAFTGIQARTTKVFDLSPYAVYDTLYLRFRLASANSTWDAWMIDDILVAGKPDSDNDGLSDEDESRIGTNPRDPDTDNDGIPDGWEVIYGLDPFRNDAGQDRDNDGLTNREEYQRNTNPADADSDDDRLSDGEEVKVYRTNPKNPDSDADGLSDYDEVKTHHTNPNNRDTDADGLTDRDEVQVYGTNPNLADSDADGLWDRDELNTYRTNPKDPDSDDDGLPDGWEVRYGLNPLDRSDANRDPDRDGLTNQQEYQLGTDPNNPDTDHDGIPDAQDPNPRPVILLPFLRK